MLEVVNSHEYRDLPPKQVVPRLADDGRYIGSESTIYRILRAEGQDAHRGRAKPRTVRSVDAHVATAANQVWSWDITYLLSSLRGRFFYLYLVEDVWSRRIVGFEVHAEECMAEEVDERVYGVLDAHRVGARAPPVDVAAGLDGLVESLFQRANVEFAP